MQHHHRLHLTLPILVNCLFWAPALQAQTTAAPTDPATASAAADAPAANQSKKDDVVHLSVFEVTDSSDIGYQSANAAEVTRMNTPIQDIPMNVTVFNQAFIEDLVATNTSELLAYESSAVKTTENDGFLSRGFSSVGSNFLNGFAQTGGFGSQPLANIERVEVIRGPAAVLYGAGGFGGIYNRITKRPKADPFFTFRTIFETAEGASRTEFDFNRPLIEKNDKGLFFRLNGTYARGDNWFGIRADETSFAPSLTWKISSNTDITAEYFSQHHVKQASWETPMHAGDPHGITTGDGVYRLIPRQTHWVSDGDYRDNKRSVFGLDLRHSFTNDLQFRSQFQYETKVQSLQETFAESQGLTILRDTALMPRRWRNLPNDTKNYRTRNELVWKVNTGPIKHRLLLGHAYDEAYTDAEDYRSPGNYGGITDMSVLLGNGIRANNQVGNDFNYFPDLTYAQFLADPTKAGFILANLLPLNLLDRSAEPPVPDISARPKLYPNAVSHTHIRSESVYINDVFSFLDDRFFVMAGARYLDITNESINYLSGPAFPNRTVLTGAPKVIRSDNQISSSYGAVWHLTPSHNYSLYVNQNNSFDPQFQNQPDGTPLDPTTGEQQEIGFRFSLQEGRFVGLVTYFDILQNGVLQADPNNLGYFVQVDGQNSKGTEFSLNARITDQWSVFGGYSYTDARDINDRPVFLQPEHRFTMFNSYRFKTGKLNGLSLSLGTIFTGERPLQPTTTRNEPNWGPLPSYWRVDAIANYRFKTSPSAKYRFDVALKISNVLDDQDIYFVAQNHRFTIDPGRVIQIIGGVRF